MTTKVEITKEQANEVSWRLGRLRNFLKPSQRKAYDFTEQWKVDNPDLSGPIVWNMHRGFGKSFSTVLMANERCQRLPNQEVRWCAPGAEQADEIYIHQFDTLMLTCPEYLRPTRKGNTYYFRNPQWGDSDAVSKLHIVGCRNRAQSHRGKRSDMIIIDECRDIEEFEYVVTSVFGFTFATRDNPLMLLSSTPPDSSTHMFTSEFIPTAKVDGSYYECKVTDNPDWDFKDELNLVKLCRGKDTVSWKREALCMLVSDDSQMICPEYNDARDETFVDTWTRPEYYVPMVVIDIGWNDCTAILFCYLDWEAQKLVVEDEIVRRYLTTKQIVDLVRQKERELWKDAVYYKNIKRICDGSKHEVESIKRDYKMSVQPAEKWDRDASIASMRAKIQSGHIRILKNCNILDTQLESGVWNRKRTDFERTSEHGHWDAGMALVYANRKVQWRHNPNQKGSIDDTDKHVREQYERENGGIEVTHNPPVVTHFGAGVRSRKKGNVIRFKRAASKYSAG